MPKQPPARPPAGPGPRGRLSAQGPRECRGSHDLGTPRAETPNQGGDSGSRGPGAVEEEAAAEGARGGRSRELGHACPELTPHATITATAASCTTTTSRNRLL
ncbi:unnamed protein product [Lampetra fluviatilis]